MAILTHGGCMPIGTLNERIREVRHALQLSQISFSKAVYISNGYLAEIELGHRKVNDRLIQLIVSVFGVNKHWLVTGEGQMRMNTPEEKLERITSLFKDLNPKFQDYVLKQIDQLIELQNQTTYKPDKA